MENIRKLSGNFISYFFILLFCYAAVSKIADFENFQIQIAQSPMLSSFAGFISYGVLIVELAVCVLLIFPGTRTLGLFASYVLMVLFTVYIYLILNYSEFVPCSCGGILEKMGWQTHFIFNIICTIVAGIAVIFLTSAKTKDRIKIFISLAVATVISISGLYVLHQKSENLLHRENSFIRRFPQHPISESGRFDLELNSYYFAGLEGDDIYLGNSTAPFTLSKLTEFKNLEDHQLISDKNNYNFQLPILNVSKGKVTLQDVSVPVIFEGTLASKRLSVKSLPPTGINKILRINDSISIVTGYNRSKDIQNLGKLLTTDRPVIVWKPDLLEKVKDGYFDPDGALHYDQHLNRLVYVYNYKNKFFTTDTDLNLIGNFTTIDSVSVPDLDIVRLKDGSRKLGTKAVTVNKKSAVHRGVLFIESDRVGKYEYKNQWKRSITIDMYSITQQKYLGSFYIPKPQGQKRMQFMVTDQNLYVIIENEIIRYSFAQNVTQHFITGKAENLNKE